MSVGLSRQEAKRLREKFSPSFATDFSLKCPRLDSSMSLRMKAAGTRAREPIQFEKRLLSIQYKVLVIGRPLLDLWSRLDPGEPGYDHVLSTIQLWATAFSEISGRRRKAVLGLTDPSLQYLVDEPVA